MTSLRRRLLAMLIASFTGAWLVLVLLTFWSTRHEVEELFDAELAQSARVLLSLALQEIEEEGKEALGDMVIGGEPGHRYEEKIAFQIFKGERLMLRSANAPKAPLAAAGFSDQRVDGATWRVFVLPERQHDVRVMVAERYDVRDELIYKILLDTLLPVLAALPLLAVLIWPAVGGGLAPLKRVAREIARRSPLQLDAVATRDVPEEIRPLAVSLNGLLARLAEAFESERRFTASAAHELRTPLAGLKAQAEVALAAQDEPPRRQALAQIIAGVDRAAHLLEQLLTLARLDPEAAAAALVPVDLATLAREAVAELAPAALEKSVDIGFEEAGRGRILGNSAALSILLRNLVDNAIRYTPPGGRVDVAVVDDEAGAHLTVCDNGPGIPERERARVFERFYRLPGSKTPGCGLGLAIAQRVSELHRAGITLATAPSGHGLLVEISFSASGAPA